MSSSTKSRKSKSLLSSHHKIDDKDSPAARTFTLPTDKHLLELASKEDYKCILKDVVDRVILFEFFAHWCGPCKVLTAKLNEIAVKYKGKLLIVKIDVDEYEDLAVEQNVSAIPTFMIVKNKEVMETFSNSNVELLEQTLVKFAGEPGAEE